MEHAAEISQKVTEQEINHIIPEWLTLDCFPDDARFNLSLRGRKFLFQNNSQLRHLLSVISPAQLSRYRSDLVMTIPLSTIRILIEEPEELFMTSFTVTSVGNKKTQLPIKLPVKTQKNSLTKLLALLCLSKNVFSTGTYQTDQYEKVKAFLDALDEVFDVTLVDEIPQNKRGYYLKIPQQLGSAIVKAVTGEFNANNPQIIRSILKCEEEQDILEFVQTWLSFSRLYRFDNDHDCLFMFRANDETRELVKLLDKIGISVETGSIFDRDTFVPVYRINNTSDNNSIIRSTSFLTRLKSKIKHQDSRIKELESIKENLEDKLNATKDNLSSKQTWSRGVDERLIDHLAEKVAEFERILIETRKENRQLRVALKGYDEKSVQLTTPSIAESPEFERLRDEVHQLKEQLDQAPTSSDRELTYKVTKEVSMKMGEGTRLSDGTDFQIRLYNLLKTFLAHKDNWILFLLAAKQPLSIEEIKTILGQENRLQLRKSLNNFIDSGVITVKYSDDEEELFYINEIRSKDLIAENRSSFKNKDNVPLEVRQLARTLFR